MKEKILSIIFVTWFFGSIGLAWYGSRSQNTFYLIFISIGQIFFIIGTMFVYQFIIKSKSNRIQAVRNSVLVMIPIIGLGITGFGLDAIFNLNITEYAAALILSLFPLFGALLIISSLIPYLYYKKHCTYEILAQIVKVKTRVNKTKVNGRTVRHVHYCPIYEIYYNEKKITLCDNTYSKTQITSNEKKIIKINPDKPQEFTTENAKKSCIFSCILGCIFLSTIFIIIQFL